MNKNNFDKYMREQLANHEVTPPPAVWENIQGHLSSAAKNQYRWLAGLLFVVIALGGLYYLLSTRSAPVPNTQAPTNLSQLSSEANPAASKQDVSTQTSRSLTSSGAGAQTTIGTTAEPNHALDPSIAAGVTPRAKQQASGTKEKTADDEAKTNLMKGISSRSAVSDLKLEPAETSLSQQTSIARGQNRGQGTFAGEGARSTKEVIKTDVQTRDSDDDAISLVQQAWAKNKYEAAPFIRSAEKGYGPVRTAAFLSLEERQRKALNEFDVCATLFPSLEDCPKFGDRRRRYQIDAYTHVGALFSHLTNNDLDVEVNSYLNQRRTTEVPSWYLGFGLRLSTQWTNGISLRGGLQISQSQIRVEYLDETQRQTTVNVSIDTLVDQDGNTTVVWDTISVIETGVENRQFHNTFTQIDLPVTLGYTFFGPRYDVELNAGVMFNVLFQRSGRVFAPEDGTFYELGRTGAPPGTQPYRAELGLSLVTSVALNYRLSPQFSVFIEPQLRYFVDPVSPASYSLQENWFMGSLMLGGRYAF